MVWLACPYHHIYGSQLTHPPPAPHYEPDSLHIFHTSLQSCITTLHILHYTTPNSRRCQPDKEHPYAKDKYADADAASRTYDVCAEGNDRPSTSSNRHAPPLTMDATIVTTTRPSPPPQPPYHLTNLTNLTALLQCVLSFDGECDAADGGPRRVCGVECD